MNDRQPRFREVSARADFPALDARILAFWKDADIFHKSLAAAGDDAPVVRLLRGPADGQRPAGLAPRPVAHLQGHLSALQDHARLPRAAQGGWDCHGLPVELEVERRLGIDGKEQIEDYGVAEFNELCRESVADLPQGVGPA